MGVGGTGCRGAGWLIAVGLAGVVLSGCGESPSAGSQPTSVAAPPATSTGPVAPGTGTLSQKIIPYDRPPATLEDAFGLVAAAGTTPLRRFRLPSGDLVCDLVTGDGTATCQYTASSVAARFGECRGAGSAEIGRLTIGGGRVFASCVTGDAPDLSDVPVLPDGDVAKVAETSVQCLSRPVGITCVDLNERNGFFAGRDEYRLYGR